MRSPSERLARAHLYLVCGEQSESFLEAALRGGVDVIQLRMKDASDAEVVQAAARYRSLCRRHGALFLVNDRPDLAVEAGADGVHVGQGDVPVAEARRMVGADRLVGLSTHSPQQIDDVAGIDYIGVGPVYATPTKPGRPPVGLELVSYAARAAGVPFFAIGGISADNLAAVAGAGASRIAVVRALTEAADPERVARLLRGAVAAREEAVVGST